MRQHKLSLCKEHYLDWVTEQVERTIHRYSMFSMKDKVLVAVSGGKDSLSLWDILIRLGYAADGLYIGLGIDKGIKYSDSSLHHAQSFAEAQHLTLHVVDIEQEYGETIPDIALRTNRGHYKPCSVCGVAKRHVMNRITRHNNYSVLVTGHNLDDEAAILFGNTMNWIGTYLVHQYPVLEADDTGLTRKAKPLCRMYEREMAAYAMLRGIDYIQDECPFAFDSTSIYNKTLLDKLEFDRPGAKLNFYLSFLKAKREGLFSNTIDKKAEFIHSCPNCGQATSAPGLCAFCRMLTTTKMVSAQEDAANT